MRNLRATGQSQKAAAHPEVIAGRGQLPRKGVARGQGRQEYEVSAEPLSQIAHRHTLGKGVRHRTPATELVFQLPSNQNCEEGTVQRSEEKRIGLVSSMTMKSLWASVQENPVLFRKINGWLTVIWFIAAFPICIFLSNSVPFLVFISVYAVVTGHLSTWQASRVEVRQEEEKIERDEDNGADLEKVERKVDELHEKV